MLEWFQRYLLAGFVFQSAIVAGAYSSGAEMLEFFYPYGPWGGVLAILVSAACFSIIFAVGLEYARRFALYDYRSYMRHLLGRAWPLYEVMYIIGTILILSVIGAAAGILVEDMLGYPKLFGSLFMMGAIGLLAFLGTGAIEKFLASWSLVLYALYIAFFTVGLSQFGPEISEVFANVKTESDWMLSGMHYAGYVILIIPAMSFVARHLETKKHAVISGLMTGPLAMIPALLFFMIMMGQYDAMGAGQDIPLTILLNAMQGADIFFILFPLVLFGTFVETGVAFLHGINERIDHFYEERRGGHMPRWMRPVVAVGVLIFAVYLASAMGLTGLVAQGYGTLAFGVIATLAIPLLTLGIYRVFMK